MKYVILIHSDPQPWGHPTGDYLAEFQAMPKDQRDRSNAEFERLLSELQASGELLGGEALGDPTTARLYRGDRSGETLVTDGLHDERRRRVGNVPTGRRSSCCIGCSTVLHRARRSR